MLVYLAGPIDHAIGHEWRDEIRELLGPDVSFFDPLGAFQNVKPGCPIDVCQRVYDVNSCAISMSNAMVLFAKPSPEVFMVGSWRELEIARRYNTPVCIVTDKNSVYMFDAKVVGHLEEAAYWVKELMISNERAGERG